MIRREMNHRQFMKLVPFTEERYVVIFVKNDKKYFYTQPNHCANCQNECM